MGYVICGECQESIPDHSGCYEAALYPDVNNQIEGKSFEVYECQDCGSLTIFYDKYSGKGFHVYTSKNGKCNDLTTTKVGELRGGS